MDDCPQNQEDPGGTEHGQFSQPFIGQTQHSVSLLWEVPGHMIVMQDVSVSVAWLTR